MSHPTWIERSATAARAAERSIASSSSSPAPPGLISCPSARVKCAPSAWSKPAPPSVQALPPTPTMIDRAPASSAIRMSSPLPREVAWSGSSTPPSRRRRPDASASSTTASSGPIHPRREVMGVPFGPVTRCRVTRACDPRARSSTSSVPSPPSATGIEMASAPASLTPRAMAVAAACEPSVPLNAFGAQTATTLPRRRGSGPDGAGRGMRLHGEESPSSCGDHNVPVTRREEAQ